MQGDGGALHSEFWLQRVSTHTIVCRHGIRIDATPEAQDMFNTLELKISRSCHLYFEHEPEHEGNQSPLRRAFSLLRAGLSRTSPCTPRTP